MVYSRYYEGREKVKIVGGNIALPQRFLEVYKTKNQTTNPGLTGFLMENKDFHTLRLYDNSGMVGFPQIPGFEIYPLKIDKTGLITLSEHITHVLELDNQAFITGDLECMEVWKPETLGLFEKTHAPKLRELAA
ncbi:hypothetical protein CMI46_02380 [Candidatus Pacearchaeota archaeon]|nr:hypothetical protein [Candidatus Pacearchaeota archaeon]|tara:strand:- start:2570 stop:2971 length:402 start_codon:yes stop_codon:yes gene_type:complete